MNAIYHVAAPDGTQYGQMDEEAIRAKLADGTLPADTLVWKEGWTDWRPVSDLIPTAAPEVKAWSILSAVKTVYLSRYATFTGRAGRREFWFATIASWVAIWLYIIAGALLSGLCVMFGDDAVAIAVIIYVLLLFLLLLFCCIPGIALMVRRLHDIGLSGWFVLLYFIPTFGTLALLVCAVLPSAGPNRWGHGADRPAA